MRVSERAVLSVLDILLLALAAALWLAPLPPPLTSRLTPSTCVPGPVNVAASWGTCH
jgi:hypothetical protein